MPVWPQAFPFSLSEPTVRARVTLTIEVLASDRLAVTDSQLWDWVADRLGQVTDNGPYVMRVSPYGQQPQEYVPVSLGTIHDGPVEWVDGSAPEAGWHCGDCRQPKRVDAGRCQRLVQFHGHEFPCGNEDADHHGSCSFRPQLRGRGASASGVA